MNASGKRRITELHSLVISVLIHGVVLAGIVALKFEPFSGEYGSIKVRITDSTDVSTDLNANKKQAKLNRPEIKKSVIPRVSEEHSNTSEVEKPLTKVERSGDENKFADRKTESTDTPDVTEVDHVQPIVTAHISTTVQPVTDMSGTKEQIVNKLDVSKNSSAHAVYTGEFGKANGPKFKKKVLPLYPLYARRLGKEGRVVLFLLIDEQGQLMNIEVLESAGYGFDSSAVKAVKMSTFLPAQIDGTPVRSMTKLPIKFVLKEW